MANTLGHLLFVMLILSFVHCSNYGDKVTKEHVDVFYKKGIEEVQAQQTADLLYYIDTTYNQNIAETKSFQLLKQKDTVTFRMVVVKEKLAGVDDESFLAISNLISENVFDKQPVNIELTDNKFNTLRKLPFTWMDLSDDNPALPGENEK
ncbi:MAG: hypothetical protein H0V30_09685 [Chitinophagaceae bacterium]|nr:hypothetical protein [Chitinophagaceae bacterium]